MGALAHYLERESIPTTQISLIYEHTEKIRPPRALWVPFELGRPLGVPENARFQKKVLRSVLELLEAEQGPVLAAFEEEAPGSGSEKSAEADVWSCPVNFSPPRQEETDPEKRVSVFKREMAQLRPWYDQGVEKRGRTAMTDFDPETAAAILSNYLLGEHVEIPRKDISLAVALRLAAQDLKSFYFEAANSRPGARTPDIREFAEWYWNRTTAGWILKEIQKKCADEQDKELRLTGKTSLVPAGENA